MSGRAATREPAAGAPEVRYRPMYARALGLRHLHPGGMLCFVFFEGTLALGLLLALAELVSWWVVVILPVSVALMVKVNDLVAGAVTRSAARTPERERERVRREVIAFMPTLAHATISPAGRAGSATARRPEHRSTAPQPEGATTTTEDATGTAGAEPASHALAGETTAVLPVIRVPDLGAEAAVAAGRRDTAGRYAAAGRYLDEVWRQHAYAMAHHADHSDPGTTQRERQAASRRYE